MLKENKGITLVALIITIIVMLILAGVSISLVLGQNGVLTQAKNANKSQIEAALRDAISMANADIIADFYGSDTAKKTAATYTGTEATDIANATSHVNACFDSYSENASYSSGAFTVTVSGETVSVPATISGTANSYLTITTP